MKPLKEIKTGELIAVYPFEGVKYEEPENDLILDSKDFRPKIAKELRKRGLLPLTLGHKKIGLIARLIGYILGDGWIYKAREKRRGRKKIRKRLWTHVAGNKEDLEIIASEVNELGFKASRVYERERKISGKNYYGNFETISHEYVIHITSKAFSSLFNKLGIVIGKKTNKNFLVPQWVMSAPLWIKRNFLAGLFGAELTEPLTLTKHAYNFQQPQLTIGKYKKLKKSGIKFLEQIKRLLEEFGIRDLYIYTIPGTEKTVGLRLVIPSREANLLRLWSNIGYEYNNKRQFLACMATQYLNLKKKRKSELKDRSKPQTFPTFPKFVELVRSQLKHSGMVYEVIEEKRLVRYDGFVYDFTVDHKDHNFIANNFVVSNCGVRLLRTNLTEDQVRPRLKELLESIFRNVPCGVGRGGKLRLSISQLDEVLTNGAKWAVKQGYGTEKDLEHLEERGCMEQANPEKVSAKAKKRGAPQLGTLGAGNHFLEIQRVEKIFLPEIARVFGIENEGQVMVMIHTGSRGFGHQVCTDYLRILESKFRDEIKILPDRELVYAPAGTKECEDYFQAMCCAANFGFTNRHMIMHWVRESLVKTLGMKLEDIGLELVYGLCHNIGKVEKHRVDGEVKKLYVHRKGATRAFGPGREDVPKDYRRVGQPVLLPSSMGTSSFVAVGTKMAEEQTFSSIAHGAGRVMSRHKALKRFRGEKVKSRLATEGILVRAASWKVLAEEAPEVYKLGRDVMEACEKAGIAKTVVELRPLGVCKG